jgi:hypothetical protein
LKLALENIMNTIENIGFDNHFRGFMGHLEVVTLPETWRATDFLAMIQPNVSWLAF